MEGTTLTGYHQTWDEKSSAFTSLVITGEKEGGVGAIQSRKSLWMTAASEAALDLQIEGTDLVVSVIPDLPHPGPSCCHFPGCECAG